jgi:alpha-L-rhamnosidase
MKGIFIGVKGGVNTFTVEKKFVLSEFKSAVLKATALGTYFAVINGKRVGDAYLAPGWTSYHKTLQYQEYDVTDLLTEGENTIAITINEGWYAGPLTWNLNKCIYGKQTAVCAELDLGDKNISTDLSWTARESYIRESGIYHGETVDYTIPLKPLELCEVALNKSVLVLQQCEPVRDIERLKVMQTLIDDDGCKIYDFGQNFAGVAEVITPSDFNGTLTLHFAEVLINGKFYTDNLRRAKAVDTFTVNGTQTLVSQFTYHGFRYLKISGGDIPDANVTGIVRHTDMKRTGSIITSNLRFNRFLQNVVWGQRSNFVDIPTDCPQRDERLGWTGDINVFCQTAAFNYDIRAFMKKWLRDLRSDQSVGGKIPSVIPTVLDESEDRKSVV